jgi:hypothetical protein
VRPKLSGAEAVLLRVAEGFLKPMPTAKQVIPHVVLAAMIVAASGTPFGSLPQILSGYLETIFYESFVDRVKSIVTAIQALRDVRKRNNTLKLSALTCFLVTGVRGLFLGPRTCSPSGAIQHVHLIALAGTAPAGKSDFPISSSTAQFHGMLHLTC